MICWMIWEGAYGASMIRRHSRDTCLGVEPAPPEANRRSLEPVHPLIHLQRIAGNYAVQRLLCSPLTVQRYRPAGSQNHGAANGTLVEQAFKSRKKQPWISLIDIDFSGVKRDTAGENIPSGSAKVGYHPNAHALSGFSIPVTGGPVYMRSDPGTFYVHRIEGVGYNDPGAASVMAEAARKAGKRVDDVLEGPKRGAHRRYTKPAAGQTAMDVAASMHLAVFYNKGEALHNGSLDERSHGCAHVSDWDSLVQLNYHSVIGQTVVKVRYSGAAQKLFAP
jgi:hypothetical protein